MPASQGALGTRGCAMQPRLALSYRQGSAAPLCTFPRAVEPGAPAAAPNCLQRPWRPQKGLREGRARGAASACTWATRPPLPGRSAVRAGPPPGFPRLETRQCPREARRSHQHRHWACRLFLGFLFL